MIRAACVNTQSGEIEHVYSGELKPDELGEGLKYVLCADTITPGTHYAKLVNGEYVFKEKKELPITVQIKGLTAYFIGLPKDTVIRYRNQEIIADGVSDCLEVDLPGNYPLSFENTPCFLTAFREITFE